MTTMAERIASARRREATVVKMRQNKMTFSAIGKALGISSGRANYLFGRSQRRLRYDTQLQKSVLDLLLADCPEYASLSESEFAKLIAARGRSDLARTPNLGTRKLEVITNWLKSLGLGFPEDEDTEMRRLNAKIKKQQDSLTVLYRLRDERRKQLGIKKPTDETCVYSLLERAAMGDEVRRETDKDV